MRDRSSTTDDLNDHLKEVLLMRLLKSALQERGVLLTEKGALVLDSLVGTALKLAADIREIEGSADPFVTLVVGACVDGNAPSHANISNAFGACSQIQKKFLARHLHFASLFTIGLYSQDDLSTTFAERLVAVLLSDSREHMDAADAAGYFSFAEGQRPVRNSVDLSSDIGSVDLSSPVLYREDLQTQLGALLKCVASWDALHPDIQMRTSVLEDPSRPLEYDFQGFAAALCGVLSIGLGFTCSLSLLDPRILEFRSYSWTAAMRERLAVFSEFELLVFWLRSFVGFVASCRALKRQYGSFQKWSSFFSDIEFGK